MKIIYNIYFLILIPLFIFYVTILTIIDMFLNRLCRKTLDKRFYWLAVKVLNLVKLDYQVINRDNIRFKKNTKYIVMCNHASFFDIPLAVVALNTSVRMLVKKELMKIPIWGKAMSVSDFVSIDRKNSKQALYDLKKAEVALQRGIVLWIAPEGTRSQTGKIQPFKRGGFKLAMDIGAVIIPMGIRGSNKIMPAKSIKINRGEQVEVFFGTPIDASTYTNKNRKELIKEVEGQIRTLCDE
jgi:1-acyl-sn-glycerol-3-phosphate acyltransferase